MSLGTALVLSSKVSAWDRAVDGLNTLCRGCTGFPDGGASCVSLDCPVLYRRANATFDAAQIEYVVSLMEKL